jgi:hypothetical protein
MKYPLPAVVIISIVFLFLSVTESLALSITISNLPPAIEYSQEAETEVFFECSGCGDSFMRGVFYPSGTNYFGYTKNNAGEWISTVSDRTKYFKIASSDLIEASWSGKLKIKPDSQDPAYLGPGEYLFKIGRYTSAGDSSADWSNELAVKINGPTATPTPVPTIVSTNTPNSTASPAPTKSSTPTPSKFPTPKPTKSTTPKSSESLSEVLGLTTESSPDATLSPDDDANKKKSPLLPAFFIGSGVLMVGFAVYNLVRARKNPVQA